MKACTTMCKDLCEDLLQETIDHEGSIDLAMCLNRMQFTGALAAIHSIARNSKRPQAISFHLVVGKGEAEEFLRHIRKCFPNPKFRVEIREFRSTSLLEDYIRDGREFSYASPAALVMNFSRFYLPQVYPELGKVIFLDADLIVQGDIAELYALAELNQDLLAAVASGSWRTYGGVHRDSLHLRGLDLDQPVFNAGVYVTDLGRWPEQGVQEKLEGWIAIHRKSLRDFAFGTQSIMNLAFYGKFQRLPAEWNVRPLGNHPTIPQETLKAAKILHWAGKRKPWTADGLYKEYWIDYAFDVESSENRGGAQP